MLIFKQYYSRIRPAQKPGDFFREPMMHVKNHIFPTILFCSFITLFCFKTKINAAEKDGIISDSLDFKIGQMIMVGFRGLDIDESHPIAKDIYQWHIGGVVLFDYDVPGQTPIRNIQSLDQLKRLTNHLRALTSTPLLIAIDYEGGQITRLKETFGFPATLSAHVLGEKNDPEQTFAHSGKMARTLKEVGINLNLAPVVDLNTNPQNPVVGKLGRSYSSDPEIVIEHAIQFIRAHHENNIPCTLKHFPGHGSARGDTHNDLIDVTDTWSENELIPYENLIRTGQVDAIMTAHLLNRHLDPDFPATLSDSIISGILRNRLGYDGIVISDDLQMDAIRKNFDLEMTIFLAINAGVDILLFANNSIYEEDIGPRSVQIIRKLISDKKISANRIGESYRRIKKIKRILYR